MFESLLEGMNLPFRVMEFPLPSKFKIPLVEAYDNGKDPLDHIRTDKAHMFFHGPSTRSCVGPSQPL
jgi:hypothetical protein